jgi:hypothetical protein
MRGSGRSTPADRLDRLALGAAGTVLATMALAVPAVLAGWWTAVVAGLVVAASLVAVTLVLRRSPGRTSDPTPGREPASAGRRRAALPAVLLLAVAVAAGVWAGATRAEQVVLRRDAGTYALFGQHLAQAHRARVDVRVGDLGGPTALAGDDVTVGSTGDDVTVGSPGFFEQGAGSGTHVVPQFLIGAPVWFSLGWWLGGWTGLLLVPAAALGAALLAFGVLARRLVGPWWAVLATTALAVCQPVVHAGRSTYSEPFALLLLCAGAAVLVDAGRAATADRHPPDRQGPPDRPGPAGRLGLLAGLLLGGVGLVRVDALRESALLLPLAALLAVRRAGVARPMLIGLGLSTGVAAVAAVGLGRPYLGAIAGSLLPLLAGALALGGSSAAVVLLARRGVRLPGAVRARLPGALAGLVLLAGLGLTSRPLWQVVRQSADDPGSRVVAGLQARQGLPVDGGRTYAEQTVTWVVWWIGAPAAVLALLALAGLAWRAGRAWRDERPLPAWAGPALVAAGSIALTLYRPGITPDHPWADRRLVPVVLPAMVLLAAAGARTGLSLTARLTADRSSTARWRPAVVGAAATGAACLLLVPPVLATWPLAGQRTERGQVGALARACGSFGPDQTAILVDSRAANEWTQTLRGGCGVPTLVVRQVDGRPADPSAVARVARAVSAAGRRPVLVAADSATSLTRLGAAPRLVVDLATVEDQRLLVRRPDGDAALSVRLWVARAA